MSFSPVTSAARFRPISVESMRRLDRRAIEDFGVSGAVLMENAGRAISECVGHFFPRKKSIVIFCGAGNNGGDGLVAARHLANRSADVHVVLAKPPAAFSGEAAVHWRTFRAMNIAWIVFHSAEKLIKFLPRSSLCVDALLGTGVRTSAGEFLREPYRAMIQLLNDLSVPVIAVDVPSGMDSDTGEVEDVAVRADMTVTMALPKRGLVRKIAKPWVGRVWVADIGIPINLLRPYQKAR